MSELMPPVPQLLITTTKQAVRNIERTTEHGRATEYSTISDVSSRPADPSTVFDDDVHPAHDSK
ncbi:hypothetical protein [uncultured Tessaracoccus sp.]|uniref:hypothetical protein n=1 Tax=uncultured Tessaracoccus sp. TaxID=905023 RepID=UPI00261BC1EF|nr:hypothetical protein [uncultured Tessaracoccus sp.]